MSKILIRKHEGTIYPEGRGYTGAIDLGYDGHGRRQRIKRKGRTKEIVHIALRESRCSAAGEPVRRWRVSRYSVAG